MDSAVSTRDTKNQITWEMPMVAPMVIAILKKTCAMPIWPYYTSVFSSGNIITDYDDVKQDMHAEHMGHVIYE